MLEYKYFVRYYIYKYMMLKCIFGSTISTRLLIVKKAPLFNWPKIGVKDVSGWRFESQFKTLI